MKSVVPERLTKRVVEVPFGLVELWPFWNLYTALGINGLSKCLVTGRSTTAGNWDNNRKQRWCIAVNIESYRIDTMSFDVRGKSRTTLYSRIAPRDRAEVTADTTMSLFSMTSTG